MPFRLLKILTLSCIALVLLWVFSLYRQMPHSNSPFAKAFATLRDIHLQQGPQAVFLHKEKQSWTVAASTAGVTFPVEADQLSTLNSALQNVQLEDVISEHTDRANDFDLEATGVRVTLTDAAGKVLADGIFGKQAPDGTHIYFRYADQPAIYLARGLFRGELGSADLTGWRDHHVISVPEEQIVSFQIQTKGNTVLVQKSSNSWTVDTQPADPVNVQTWIGAAAHLRADNFAVASSTETPNASDLQDTLITLKTSNSEVALHIGKPDLKNKRYPVMTGPESGIAWISAPSMQALLLKPSDFIKKPTAVNLKSRTALTAGSGDARP